MSSDLSKLPPLVIKRKIKANHAPHGGAWKVAYADFVTAMMAFFLLLWLLNVATESNKQGISNYFEPDISEEENSEGSGQVLAGLAQVCTLACVRKAWRPVFMARRRRHVGRLLGRLRNGQVVVLQVEARNVLHLAASVSPLDLVDAAPRLVSGLGD